LSGRAAQLIEDGVAFVEATVVRCAAPSSARPGDRAIVLGDGTIEGFVGGSCADSTVRLQALRALETGEPMLLRILPGEQDGPASADGAVVVANPCLSGGALELFLEPHLPPPRVAIAGSSPVAVALAELCEPLGLRARLGAQAEAGDFAAVVASLGHGDEEALRRGLEAGCEYVGLVASRVRGSAVLEELRTTGIEEDALRRVRTPAGVDIGAQTHAEIALSILAEIVAARRAPAVPAAGSFVAPAPREAVATTSPDSRASGEAVAPAPTSTRPRDAAHAGEAVDPAPTSTRPRDAAHAGEPVDPARTSTRPRDAAHAREAVDPVCGMTVAVGPDTPTAGEVAFCSEGCREAWLARTA
jgi:xanthine dehydrogenase accessory factor